MTKKSKPKKVPAQAGTPNLARELERIRTSISAEKTHLRHQTQPQEAQYRCWADDEDLTDRVKEKVNVIVSSESRKKAHPWSVKVVCSQGHENIFEGVFVSGGPHRPKSSSPGISRVITNVRARMTTRQKAAANRFARSLGE